MQQIAFAAAILLLATRVNGGLVYDFVTHMETPRITEKVEGRIWVEGESYRAEFERAGSRMIIISRDSDKTATVLNPTKLTWSNRSRAGADVRSAELFMWPVPGAKVRGKPKVVYRTDAPISVAGQKATAHVIDATFDVEARVSGTPLRGQLRVIARVLASETLPELPMKKRGLRTGYPTVDEELEKAERNIRGMVLRHDLEVTRTFEGGPPQVEKTTTEIVHLEQVDVDDAQFAVPDTYTYAGPATIKRD